MASTKLLHKGTTADGARETVRERADGTLVLTRSTGDGCKLTVHVTSASDIRDVRTMLGV